MSPDFGVSCPVNDFVDWSPHGDVIVASGGHTGDTWLGDPQGSSFRPIVVRSDPDWSFLSNTTWSPDGESILFTGRHRTTGEGVFRYWINSEQIEHLFADWIEPIDWQPRQGTFWDDETSVFISDVEWLAAKGITKGCNPPHTAA